MVLSISEKSLSQNSILMSYLLWQLAKHRQHIEQEAWGVERLDHIPGKKGEDLCVCVAIHVQKIINK